MLHVAGHDVPPPAGGRGEELPPPPQPPLALSAEPLSAEWRQQVHASSDIVQLWVMGERGIAATRVLYTSGGRVWQIDSDGAFPTPLTPAGGQPAAYPAWHPLATHIAYTVMTDEGRRIVV